jgi:ribonuclease III
MGRRLTPPRRSELEAALGYRFQDPRPLEEALTHASSLQRPRGGGRRGGRSYQRLEFLGDRVLGLAVAHLLIERFPDDAEGALTRRHAALVRKESLADVALRLGLGAWLQVAPSEVGSAGGVRPTLLADSCEALIGAIYLDGGLAAARAFIERYWQPLIEAVQSAPRDAKTQLQEWAMARGLAPPTYRTVATSGPAHAMTFTVEVSLPDQATVSATGATKRHAEGHAAGLMLQRIAQVPHG